jgi:predicted metalloprotease with PDZ domain
MPELRVCLGARRGRTVAAAMVAALILAWVAGATSTARAAAVPTLTLAVDATEAPRGLLHARLTIPVKAGPLALSYPKWLPGEHGPTGPILDFAGLTLSVGGKTVSWFRDSVDMYTFHCTVPAKARTIEARYDFLLPSGGQFSSGVSSTEQLVLMSWNQVMLSPAGLPSDSVMVTPTLKLPSGWHYGTALPVQSESPAGIRFASASLTTLVDSPVLAGAYFRSVPLNPGGRPAVFLDMAADSREALEIEPAGRASLERLVSEANALFGARHYRDYHFLLTLSDYTAHFGLEHHESSDDRVYERMLIDHDLWVYHSNLLPHEYVHSWNGKYRRPAGLATGDYAKPMRGEMLWVYEGLTQYLGFVLGARCGVRDPETARDALAYAAAQQELHRGRQWRPLLDTAVAAQILYNAADAWESWRRGTDFYNEGVLVWLEADATIRKESGGTKSLDDFCRRFHGGSDGVPMVRPYAYEDVIHTMNDVSPHGWQKFFDERLESVGAHAPLGGIAAAGWSLGWTDTLSAYLKILEDKGKRTEMQYSIGLLLKDDATVIDLIPGSAADKAGMTPGMKVLAVDGRKYSPKVLRAAVRAAKGRTAPIEIIAEHTDYLRTYKLDYHEGEKYPVLLRQPSKPDLLTAIFTPKAGKKR